jgi:hypothetical protein
MDYRENTQMGEVSKWTRTYKIECYNFYNEIPSITFFEEEKVKLPDGSVINGEKSEPGNVSEFLADPNKEITLLHPVTQEIIGTTTYQNLYIILYSLYLQLATNRDASVPSLTGE